MSNKKHIIIEQQGLSQVRPEDKKDWKSIVLIWAGGVICVPALMVGAFITNGLGFKSSVVAMVIGYLIVVGYMVFMAMQSEDLGVPSVVTFEGAFGKKGSSYVASTVIVFCFTSWFAFQTAICGAAFSGLLERYGILFPVSASMIIWGAIMTITAVYGFGLMKVLNLVSVPAMAFILVYAVINILSKPEAYQKIIEFQPVNPMPLIAGIGIAVGGFAAGGVLAGDITRYCKNRKETALSVIVGVLPAGIGALIVGSILAINAGSLGMDNTSIVNMLSSVGAPILGLLVLILATWTTNVSNAYTAGFALLNIAKMQNNKRSLSCFIVGVVGTLLAVFGALNYFSGFLNILGTFIPPIAGVTIMDYWGIRKGKIENWNPVNGFNLAGFLAWSIGAVVAIKFPTVLIPSINAIVISCVSYFIFFSLFNKKSNVNNANKEV